MLTEFRASHARFEEMMTQPSPPRGLHRRALLSTLFLTLFLVMGSHAVAQQDQTEPPQNLTEPQPQQNPTEPPPQQNLTEPPPLDGSTEAPLAADAGQAADRAVEAWLATEPPSFDALARLVDVDALRAFVAGGGRVAHDAMGGAGSGWLTGFFRHVGIAGAVEEVRGRPDPLFHGVHPEPIPANLAVTVERMRHADAASGPAFALANDGDADRLGVVLPGGAFLNSHQIFALLLDRLQADGRHGRVVKTFTVSRIVERLAAARGLAVEETPVGFKHVVAAMLKGGVLIGGEESGGIGVDGHIPERDGIANGLLLLEAIAKTGVGLAERFRELEREAQWRHAYDRIDLRLADDAAKRRVQAALDDPPAHVAGREVVSVERLDGVKLNLGDDAWLLVRASGTEPVLRVYCEGPSAEDVRVVLEAARRLVDEARG